MPISGLSWRPLAIGGIVIAIILVPFVVAGQRLDAWTTAVLSASASSPWTVGAIIAGLLIADVVLPIPSSIVSSTAGLLLGFSAGLLASTVGMTLGATLAYGCGRYWSQSANRFVTDDDSRNVRAAFDRYGDWFVVLTRAVPVLAESTPVVAGIVRMPFGRFLAMASLASLGVSTAYALLGATAAHAGSFLLVFLGSIAAPLGAILWLRRGVPR